MKHPTPLPSVHATKLRSCAGPGLAMALCLGLSLTGCRNKQTMAPIVLGDAQTPSDLVGDERFGPPWGKNAVETLPNQAQLVWLAQKDRPRMDLRLVIPLPGPKEKALPAPAVEIVLSLLERQLRYRARSAKLRLSRTDLPGRTEFALHGRADQFRHAAFLIGHGFSAKPNKKLLSETQGAFVASWVDNPIDHATRDQISTLLSIKPSTLYGSSKDFAKLRSKDLARAWTRLTDPRRCTLIVHSDAQTPEDKRSLQALSEQWERSGNNSKTPLARLFTPSKALAKLPNAQNSLRQTPITSVPTRLTSPTGRITWLVSRRLSLPTAKDRAFARLAQRTLQHQFDVRLVIHQKTGLWQIRKDLSPEPERAALELRNFLGDLDQALHERLVPGRARQAARTWLGARLVQNSLEGADWTALWSESLDLASSPKAIPSALQINGKEMIQADIKAFENWMGQNIDPSLARGPWISQLIFAQAGTLNALNQARGQAPPEKD